MSMQPNPANPIPEWTVADRLRKARESADLSQAELAELTGISRRTIDARAISNMATGSANLLYKHFDPQRKRAAEILEGVEQLDLTDEEALRQAERLREYAADMVYVLAARLR